MGKLKDRILKISPFAILKAYIKMKRGLKVCEKLQNEYGQDVYALVCPWPGTGDALQTGRYLKAYLVNNNIKNYVIVTNHKAVSKVFNLFPGTKVCYISSDDIYNLTHLCRFCGDTSSIRVLHHNVPLFYTSIMDPIEGLNKVDWGTIFCKVGLSLDETVQLTNPVWDTEFDIQRFCKINKLQQGRTVVLSPKANTFSENLTSGQWELIAEKLLQAGYSVCTNLGAPDDQPVHGTVGVFLPYKQLVPFLDFAGAFIAIRSGFCDIASFSSCKKIILYQPIRCGAASVYDLFSIEKIGLCLDVIEIELDMLNLMNAVKKVLHLFEAKEFYMMKDNKWLVSVIVPVYNTELYIRETIQSVVNQTIDFERNIQLILVNNGSTDNAGDICKQYQQLYPENIVYVELSHNRGQNGGRLAGLERAEGKYVNFLDSDDKWESDSFRRALTMFKKYEDTVDFVACRIKMFEGGEWHDWLDWKATHDHIVNILEKPKEMHLVMGSCFIKRKVFEKILPRLELTKAEDSTFLCECLLENPNYGVCTTLYRYRVRTNSTSDCQTRGESPDWYIPQVKYSFEYLANKSLVKYGRVIDYIQHYILRETFFHFESPICSMFNKRLIQEYVDALRGILMRIDDKWICMSDMPWREFKNEMVRLKYVGMEAEEIMANNYSMANIKEKLVGRSDIDVGNDVVWLYSHGRLGFRYIWRSIKAWIKFKLGLRSQDR